jgi:putative transposase
MKQARFTAAQIIGTPKEDETGASAADLCHKHGFSDTTVCKWKIRCMILR